jgi:16S rRNA (cytosine967-C5)-methyltransferase
VTAARRVAFYVVRRVFEDDAYADRAFRSAAQGLDERERRFAMQLAYGTVQRVRTLDHAIETLGRRPVRKLDPPVRAALRVGAFQLGFLRGVPVHAAANETVELVRGAGLERAVGFTNAVMRRLADGLPALLASLPEATPEEAALRHSYPDWIAATWWREWGSENALALMRAQNEAQETVVRLSREAGDEVEGAPVPGFPRAKRVDAASEAWLKRGLAHPQSIGSQLGGEAVGAQPGERVLDLCAAPGGKTLQLAELAREVVAVEVNEGRARELEETLERHRVHNVRVLQADARELPSDVGHFDRVLVDAPCSGLGVLASRPDLRWRARPLPDLQAELLRAAAKHLEPGGSITFAVCTVHAAENEDVVDTLGFRADDLGAEWPDFSHPRRPEFLLTLPHVHRTSGFFVARLRP